MPGAKLIRYSSNANEGNAKDVVVQDKLLKPYGLTHKNLFTGKQVHGTQISIVHYSSPNTLSESDGLLTDKPGIALGVYTADCMPIFLWTHDKKVAGVLHAGWRGASKKILSQAVKVVRSQWKMEAKDLNLFIGPHIRQCCYSVGSEVAGMFPEKASIYIPDHVDTGGQEIHLSLEKAIIEEAIQLGISKTAIESDPRCTVSNSGFFSYRKTNATERMLSFMIIEI